MTLDELNVLFHLREELEELHELRNALLEKATSTTAPMTGMPHTGNATDKVAQFAAEIADIDGRIEEEQAEIEEKEKRIAAWAATIRSIKVRLAFRLRFLQGFAWKEVADIFGNYTSEAAVKQMCYNYLKRIESNPK